MSTDIAVFQATEAALVDLESRYKGLVFDVTTPTGMAEAKCAYKDINGYSITLEQARVAEKAASLAYGRKVDSEAKRIADRIDAVRLPIKNTIETETKREQREREAAIKAEHDRIIAERAATQAAEEKRMAEARAEIARQQAEIAAQQRAQAEADAAARRKIEEEQRAARVAIEEAERTARLEREAADRVARQAREAEEAKAKAIRDAEEARLKAERDRIDADARAVAEAQRKAQAEVDAKARAEREAEEAKQREIQRLANELNDGNKMLQTFVDRFGARQEFLGIATLIKAFLS